MQQLRQFGGSTTISKLRGFLRYPLKALLAAYPGLFVINGNHVALAGGLGGPSSSHSGYPVPPVPQSVLFVHRACIKATQRSRRVRRARPIPLQLEPSSLWTPRKLMAGNILQLKHNVSV